MSVTQIRSNSPCDSATMNAYRRFHWLLSAGSVLCIVLGASAITFAQTQPTAFDLSTPKSAAKSLVQAVEDGNGESVRKVMAADGPDQEKLAAAFSDVIVSGKKLTDAARAKFGAAGE